MNASNNASFITKFRIYFYSKNIEFIFIVKILDNEDDEDGNNEDENDDDDD